MTNKIPKAPYQILLAFFVLAFTVVACNNKKAGDKKETPPDTATVKQVTPMPPVDDTVKKKPVKDPLPPAP
jgi:hypothetical protein